MTGLNYLAEEKMDIDEVECIIANLITKKYIRGYFFNLDIFLTTREKLFSVKATLSLELLRLFKNMTSDLSDF